MATVPKTFKLDGARNVYKIVDGVTLTKGAFASLQISSGKLTQGITGNGYIPAGIVYGNADGDTSSTALTGNTAGTVRATVESGICTEYAVTGVTADSDVGSFVYLTDGYTLSLTPPSFYGSVPCGVILQKKNSNVCIVYLFSLSEIMVYKATV